MFSISRTIAASQVEPVYNHVHHADTLRLLEEARLEFVRSIGFPNEALIEQGFFLVIASINIRYLRELRLGDEVEITCEESRIDGKALLVTQRIIKPPRRVVVEATVEMRCMSGETRRGILPPEDFCAAFGQ